MTTTTTTMMMMKHSVFPVHFEGGLLPSQVITHSPVRHKFKLAPRSPEPFLFPMHFEADGDIDMLG